MDLVEANDFVVENLFVGELVVFGVSCLERPVEVGGDGAPAAICGAHDFRLFTRDVPVVGGVEGEVGWVDSIVCEGSFRGPDILADEDRRKIFGRLVLHGDVEAIKCCQGLIGIEQEPHLDQIQIFKLSL